MTDDTLDNVPDDELPQPALPEEELPEEDVDAELDETIADTDDADSGNGGSPMPGWFKAALVVVVVVFGGVGYAGYLYLTGEWSFLQASTNDTALPNNEGWQPPTFGGSATSVPEASDPPTESTENDLTQETGSSPGAGGYAINDTAEPARPRLNLDVTLPTPAAQSIQPPSSSPAEREKRESRANGAQLDVATDTVLADIRDGLAALQQTLGEHRQELKRMSSLIANNELSIQQHAEDLSQLSHQVKQDRNARKTVAPPQPTAPVTPTLDIALVSMQQMGSAQAVGVRYRGHDRRVQLGQRLDGWQLSQVRIDQGTAQFTHLATGQTVTVAL